jgi:3-methyladenine DNA glycosylase AlkD
MAAERTPIHAAAAARAAVRALGAANTAAARRVRRQWSATLRTETADYVLGFAMSMQEEESWAARLVGYELIANHGQAFAALNDKRIESMAAGLADWGSIDSFGVTLAGPAWREGRLSSTRVRAWARSPDRWRRRLALVSTVRLNAQGRGDAQRTLDICARLLKDRDPMVVKAMSWALRALAKRDRESVQHFVAVHGEKIAALVKREVRNKLVAGTKSGKRTRRAAAT